MKFSDYQNFTPPTKEEVDNVLNQPHIAVVVKLQVHMIYAQINKHGHCEPTGTLTGGRAIYCSLAEVPTLTKKNQNSNGKIL